MSVLLYFLIFNQLDRLKNGAFAPFEFPRIRKKVELGKVKSLFGLASIVYVSSAVRTLSQDEIEGILEGARKRNKEHGLTGMLLHVDRNFMQYIEGPAAPLLEVYDLIKHDSRHTGIIEIVREKIAEREFADWSMAFYNRDTSGYNGSAEEQNLLESKLKNAGPGSSVARILLNRFWTKQSSF